MDAIVYTPKEAADLLGIVLGLIFIGIWLYVLTLRHQLVGTPGGWRLLVS